MTAGLASDDYRFLGRAPKEPFWRRYAEYTSFERPSAILLSKEGAFRAYVSGIASSRRDRTKTPLRYTLVVEGPCKAPIAEDVLCLFAAFANDLAEMAPGPLKVGALGKALDQNFNEIYVESALAEMRDGEAIEGVALREVENRILQTLTQLPRCEAFPLASSRFLAGGRASPASRAQFLGFIERLLIDGEPGVALAMNLASRDHVETLSHGESACAVLFAGENGDDVFLDPLEQPPKKGRPGSPNGLLRAARWEAQVEPGFSMLRWSHILMGVFRALQGWLHRRRENS